MKTKRTILLISFLFLSFFPVLSISQDKEQKKILRDLSKEWSAASQSAKQAAIRKADSLKIPVRFISDQGQVMELQRFRDGVPLYYTTHNLEGAQLIKTAEVWPEGGTGLSLTGAGETLGIWDGGGTRITHQEFGGRVTQQDAPDSWVNHATHVAATMIAQGVVPEAKGMSYEAHLDAYDWNDDVAEMAAAAAEGLLVSQHSYSQITGWYYFSNNGFWYWFGDLSLSQTEDYRFGFYSELTRQWDIIANNAPHYLIVKSAGNDRNDNPGEGAGHYIWLDEEWQYSEDVRDQDGGTDGYNSIPEVGNAKNIMTVGAVDGNMEMSDFSGWGPTDDGRIKPDIVARGVDVYSALATSNAAYDSLNGTSMSAPMVSGSVGLLLEHYSNLFPSRNPLKSSTMKGLLLHTVQDLDDPGPDYRNGWGLMNTRAAAELITLDAVNSGEFNIRESILTQGQTEQFTVTADDNGPLVVTITWSDPAATPLEPQLNPTASMLVNDLDIRIEGTDDTYFPWILDPANPANAATTGDNFRDNIEQVFIKNPTPGETYTVTISHKANLTNSMQEYSVIISGVEPNTVLNPTSFHVVPSAPGVVSLNWLKNADTDDVMLVWSENGIFGKPVSGEQYESGTELPDGGTVLFSGDGVNFDHINLENASTNHYKIYSYNANNEYSTGRSHVITTPEVFLEVPFVETFDYEVNTLPPNWESDHDNWKIVDSDIVSDDAPELQYRWSPSAPGPIRITSPPIFIHNSITNPTISFDHVVQFFNPCDLAVQISAYNDTEWEDLWRITLEGDIPSEDIVLDLNNYKDELVKISFVFDGSVSWLLNTWNIDNVTLGGEIPAETFTITASPDNPDHGTVTGQGEYEVDTEVTLTATPATGYHFINWTEDGTEVSTNAEYSFTATEDRTLIANFAVIQYTLTYIAGENGTIDGNTDQVVDHGLDGTAVTAVPNTGYHFMQWSDGLDENPRTDENVTEDLSVTASFEINTYTISVSPDDPANGSVSGGGDFNFGTQITVSATPTEGYSFTNWTEDGTIVSSNMEYTFTVESDRSLVANFSQDTYTIAASANDPSYGTVTGQGEYLHGTQVTITATPATGYLFINWKEDETEVSPDAVYTFTANGDRTLVANFAVNQYTLTYTASENGTIDGDTDQVVDHGLDGAAVTAVPNTGYHFMQWSDGSTENPRTDENVTDNLSVTAYFEEITSSVNTFNLNDIEIFPNPFNNELNIRHDSGLENITITNIVGEVVHAGNTSGTDKTIISTAELPEGVYLIKLTGRNNTVVIRKVIKH